MVQEKIKFIQHHKYIHIYHIEGLNNMLSPQSDFLIKEFKNQEKGWDTHSYNFFTKNEVINQNLTNLLYKISYNYYSIDDSWRHISPMIYYQDKNNSKNIFHNHYDTCTLTSTTYIDPLEEKDGGGLEFYFHQKHIINISPQPDCIYFFPSWVLHRPLPQTSNKARICINWGLDVSNRPIHKLTGDRW